MRYAPVILWLALCLCANQMPPGGGPDDTRPPRVVRTEPADRSVNQSTRTAVTLEFSEWVDPHAAKRGISVFPPIEEGFDIGVRGRTVTVTPAGALADSTTYHVVVSTGLEDLHRVSIGASHHLVFSTGPVLDSGRVSGCVFDPAARGRQPKVAFYEWERGSTSDTALLGRPAYLAQADSAGRFSLRHIRRGTYAVVGFVDVDGNGLPGFGAEQAYAPAYRLVTVDSVAGPLELFGVAGDTATIRVASLSALTPRLLLGQWGRAGKDGPAAPDSTWRIVATDSTLVAPGIDTVLALDEAGRFAVRLGDTLTAAAYRLVYRPCRRPRPEEAADTLRDTVRFNGVVTPDTTAPVLRGVLPKGTVGLEPTLKLFWSKPVRCRSRSWPLADSTGDTVELAIDTAYGDTVTMTPRRRLRPATRYSLTLPPDSFEDLAGNHPVDTSDTPGVSITFPTMVGDSLCFSLSGRAVCTTGFANGVWMFTPLARGRPAITTSDSAGAFRFDSIPGGRGALALFDDLDGDGKHTPGSLFPWSPPEPLYAFGDTVEARARWDIEGVSVDNCEQCREAEAGEGAGPAAGGQEPAESGEEREEP